MAMQLLFRVEVVFQYVTVQMMLLWTQGQSTLLGLHLSSLQLLVKSVNDIGIDKFPGLRPVLVSQKIGKVSVLDGGRQKSSLTPSILIGSIEMAEGP